MVFGLDHLVSEQEAAPEEIDAIREWLKREGTCFCLRRTTTWASPTTSSSGRWNTGTTAIRWCRASNDSASTRAR